MRRTGRRSSTEGHRPWRCGGRRLWSLALCLTALGIALGLGPSARMAAALDVFTLWQQPQVPLRLAVGTWVEYKSSSLAGGRREEDLLRIQCVGSPDGRGGKADSWLLEILPLQSAGESKPAQRQPGEGIRLRLAPAVLARQGNLLDAVVSVHRWHQGVVTELSSGEWREDPLIAATFGREFRPDRVENQDRTVRVIGKQELRCEQFMFSSQDTQSVKLPAGHLIQISHQEVTAAVHPDIPFLGLAYVAERVRAESHLDPPSSRFSAPGPQASVETLECIGFGADARPLLAGAD